jgi:hypothetical protein
MFKLVFDTENKFTKFLQKDPVLTCAYSLLDLYHVLLVLREKKFPSLAWIQIGIQNILHYPDPPKMVSGSGSIIPMCEY